MLSMIGAELLQIVTLFIVKKYAVEMKPAHSGALSCKMNCFLLLGT